ncbi:MAG: secretion system protein [Verrucomicrobiaceae bacterium]|nr:secretion system protein [Verrucomicrobiaceae bacterium]
MMQFIVVTCVALTAFVFVHYTLPATSALFKEYGERTSTITASSLTDMFIFIEEKRVIHMMAGMWAFSFFLTWMFSGKLILAAVISCGTALLPKFTVNFLRRRRQARFLIDLPDALLGISNMMKAGSNLTMALETMVEEAAGPIAQEFGLFLRELRMGVAFEEALDNLYARMPVAELQLVVAGMKISREVGGSLADVLSRLADTIRRRLEMEGKIKSLTAQGKMQGVVMSCLPIFVGYLLYHIEPAAMAHLFTDYTGWGVCAVVIVGEYIGYRFIKKIVTIDV